MSRAGVSLPRWGLLGPPKKCRKRKVRRKPLGSANRMIRGSGRGGFLSKKLKRIVNPKQIHDIVVANDPNQITYKSPYLHIYIIHGILIMSYWTVHITLFMCECIIKLEVSKEWTSVIEGLGCWLPWKRHKVDDGQSERVFFGSMSNVTLYKQIMTQSKAQSSCIP